MIKKMLIGAIAGFSMLASGPFCRSNTCCSKAGQGTTVWAEIITKELEKHLGERIVLRLHSRST